MNTADKAPLTAAAPTVAELLQAARKLTKKSKAAPAHVVMAELCAAGRLAAYEAQEEAQSFNRAGRADHWATIAAHARAAAEHFALLAQLAEAADLERRQCADVVSLRAA